MNWRQRLGAFIGGFDAGQHHRRLRGFRAPRAHVNALIAASGPDITARARWRVRNNGCAVNAIRQGIEFDRIGRRLAYHFFRRHPGDSTDPGLSSESPFNISDWDGDQLREDHRWKFGTPPVGNANFARMAHVHHHLSANGIAGVVMANGSMSSMQSGEGEIRKAMVQQDAVDPIVALPGQLSFGTQIPACLWILAKDKSNGQDGGN